MEFCVGDILQSEGAIAHCIGADLAFGAGLALQIRNKLFDKNTEEDLRSQNPAVGGCVVFWNNGRVIYNLVTKQSSRRDRPTMDDFQKSVIEWRDRMELAGESLCNIPLLGCGLDRLDWELSVRPCLENAFRDSSVKLKVWRLDNPTVGKKRKKRG